MSAPPPPPRKPKATCLVVPVIGNPERFTLVVEGRSEGVDLGDVLQFADRAEAERVARLWNFVLAPFSEVDRAELRALLVRP